MPRKADALDAVKISSRGQPLEMGEVIEIPKRGRKPKQSIAVPEHVAVPEPVAIPVPPVAQEAAKESKEEAVAPPRKLDTYVVVKDSKAWLRGSLITFQAGRTVADHTHGAGTVMKLLAQGVELKKIEE